MTDEVQSSYRATFEWQPQDVLALNFDHYLEKYDAAFQEYLDMGEVLTIICFEMGKRKMQIPINLYNLKVNCEHPPARDEHL